MTVALASFVYLPALAYTNGCDAAFYAFERGGLSATLNREVVVNSCLEPAVHVQVTDPTGAVIFDGAGDGIVALPWDARTGVYIATIETALRTVSVPFVIRPLAPGISRVVVDGELHLAILGMKGRTVDLDVIDLDNPDRLAGTLRFAANSDLITRRVATDMARCVVFQTTTACFPDQNGDGAVCKVLARQATVGQLFRLGASQLGIDSFGKTTIEDVIFDTPGTYTPTVAWTAPDGRTGTAHCPQVVVAAARCSSGEIEVRDMNGATQCEPPVMVTCAVQSTVADAGADVLVRLAVSPPGVEAVVTLRHGDGSTPRTVTVSGKATVSMSYAFPGEFSSRLDWATENQQRWEIRCGTVRTTGYDPRFTPCNSNDSPADDRVSASAERSLIFRSFPELATERTSRSTGELSVVDCILDDDGNVWWNLDFGWDRQWALRRDVEQLRPPEYVFEFQCSVEPARAPAGTPRTVRIESSDGLSGLTGTLDLGDGTLEHPDLSSGPAVDQIFYLDPGRFEPVFRLWHPMEREIPCGQVTVDELPDTFEQCAAGQAPSSSILYQVSSDLSDTLTERSGPGTQYLPLAELSPGTEDGFIDCRRQVSNTNSVWWRRVAGGWMSATYLEPALDEAPGSPAGTPPPIKVDATTIYNEGTVLCVEGIAADDTLNVRISSSLDAEIVGELRSNSCGVRTLGGREGTWLRIASFAASDGLSVIDGWASGNFLVPASQVDRPEAVAMAEGFVPTIAPGAGNPTQANPCVEVAEGQVRCGVSEWVWEQAGDPCNGTGEDQWDSTGMGDVYLERVDDRWTIIDQLMLALDC